MEAVALAVLLSGLPATLSVSALVRARWFAPLVRGSLEIGSIAAASALAAIALPVEAAVLEPLLPGSRDVLLACAPLGIAAAPWVAGELLSGPSAFSFEAACASVVAAQVAAAGAVLAVGAEPLVIGGAASAAAALAYLEVRGPPRPSMIYES